MAFGIPCISAHLAFRIYVFQHANSGFTASLVVDACSTTEQRFLEATMAYQAGKPIVTDEEYDQLKRELRNKNSMVVQQVRIFLPMSRPFIGTSQPGRSLTQLS